MARKRTTRNGSEEGQVTIWLTPEEILQLKSICTIRMESNLEGFKREATAILSSVALSYRLEQDISRLKDANHLTDEEMDEFLENLKVEKHDQEIFRDASKGRLRTSMQPILGDRSGTSTGRISSCQGNISELDPPELDDKGLRGGEADEESLQKAQGTERANMHGTRNADLDPPGSGFRLIELLCRTTGERHGTRLLQPD